MGVCMTVRRMLKKAIIESTLADRLVALATVVIALMSISQWQAIKGQLSEMRDAGIQTQQLIDAAMRCADAAQKAADTPDATLKSSQKLLQVDQRP